MSTVLILDNYDSFTYNLVHYVEANPNFEAVVYRNDKITLEQVAQYDTIILSPGPGLPKDAGILKSLIKKYAPTKRILGVCLGMQAIGEVFGGKLINLEKVYHGVAMPIKILGDDILFQNMPKNFTVGRYHSWVVDETSFPEKLEITAVDENDRIMAFRHREYNVYGVQFHPESILTDNGIMIIDNFLTMR